MAGFEVITYGRFWVIAEVLNSPFQIRSYSNVECPSLVGNDIYVRRNVSHGHISPRNPYGIF